MTPRDDRPTRAQRIARGLVVAAGLVVALCTILLVADWWLALRRAPEEASRVEKLTEVTKTDAAAAETLHAERERQTDVSLARKARNRRIAWVLLVAAAAIVVGGKWSSRLRPPDAPVLDALIADRFPPSPATAGATRPSLEGAAPAAGDTADPAFVAQLIRRFGRGREAAIPILQAIQDHYRYLPDEVLRRVRELTEITPAQIAGTSSFYARFRRSPVGRVVVRVCHGTACHVAGAEQITQELRRHLQIPPGQDTDPHRRFTIDAVACVGCCSIAPVMMVEDETVGRLTPASARRALNDGTPAA